MEDIQKAVITVEEVSNKNKRFVIKGAIGGGSALTYSFFQEKQDGNPTKAYTQYIAAPPTPGSSIGINYKESKGEYEGKEITYRNIMWFENAESMEVPGRGVESLETAPMASEGMPRLPDGAVVEGQEILEPLRRIYVLVDENNQMLKELVMRDVQEKVEDKDIPFD